MSNLLVQYRHEIDEQLKEVVSRITSEKEHRSYLSYQSYVVAKVRAEIVRLLVSGGVVTELQAYDLRIAEPPAHVDADMAVSLFEFAKELKTAPAVLAQKMSDHFNAANDKIYIFKAEPSNGYVNLILNREKVYQEVLEEVALKADLYGTSGRHRNKTVLIDYSAPNIAKPFGVGHLRSTVIGQALANIYNACGYTVIKDNHLGDWGTQFGALTYAYTHWGDKAVIDKNPIEELKNLYVRFTKEAETNPELKDEARARFAKLEHGDEELMKLWKYMRDISLKEFEQTYQRLNVSFDTAIGESYYTQSPDALVRDLIAKKIAHKSEEGAIVVEDLEKLPSFLIVKTDGSSLYVLRDLQCIIHRKHIFNPDTILYVVGAEQKLNFQQLFALAQKADYVGTTELQHVDFGLVMVDGAKMSTRKGTLINLEEVIDQAIEKVKAIITAKGNMSEAQAQETAKSLGTSAIVYNDLKQNRTSNIDFNWDKMLSVESGSVVYLQYTYARIHSVLEKAGITHQEAAVKKYTFQEKEEYTVALKLALYPDIILRAKEQNTPHLIATYLEDLAAAFNQLYATVSFLTTAEAELKASRLHLLAVLAQTMKNALGLLNIPVVKKV